MNHDRCKLSNVIWQLEANQIPGREYKSKLLYRTARDHLSRSSCENDSTMKSTYFPTKFSKTEDFPADCPPTTAIWGKSICMWTPNWVKASCIRLMIGMRDSIPWLPAMVTVCLLSFLLSNLTWSNTWEVGSIHQLGVALPRCLMITQNALRQSQ